MQYLQVTSRSYRYGLAIWKDNVTLTYVSLKGHKDYPGWLQRYLCLSYYDTGLALCIVGKAESTMAETAAYFLSLGGPTDERVCVSSTHMSNFDFRTAGSQCVKQLFASCDVTFQNMTLQNIKLSVEQSVTLAASSHVTWLTLHDCEFDDGSPHLWMHSRSDNHRSVH